MVDHDKKRFDRERLLEEFYRFGRGADLTLLFYAGHGIQVNNRNYFILIDAHAPEDEDSMPLQAIELDIVVRQFQRIAKVGLVLPDACRHNPGLDSRLRGATRDAFRGVRLTEVPRGTVLVLYATSSGRKALDGISGHKNSPFAEVLLANLGEHVPVETMAKVISRQVATATGRKQQPEVEGSLNEDVYLPVAARRRCIARPEPACRTSSGTTPMDMPSRRVKDACRCS